MYADSDSVQKVHVYSRITLIRSIHGNNVLETPVRMPGKELAQISPVQVHTLVAVCYNSVKRHKICLKCGL